MLIFTQPNFTIIELGFPHLLDTLRMPGYSVWWAASKNANAMHHICTTSCCSLGPKGVQSQDGDREQGACQKTWHTTSPLRRLRTGWQWTCRGTSWGCRGRRGRSTLSTCLRWTHNVAVEIKLMEHTTRASLVSESYMWHQYSIKLSHTYLESSPDQLQEMHLKKTFQVSIHLLVKKYCWLSPLTFPLHHSLEHSQPHVISFVFLRCSATVRLLPHGQPRLAFSMSPNNGAGGAEAFRTQHGLSRAAWIVYCGY